MRAIRSVVLWWNGFVEVTGLKRRVSVAIRGPVYTHSTNEKGSVMIPWGIGWDRDSEESTGRKSKTRDIKHIYLICNQF